MNRDSLIVGSLVDSITYQKWIANQASPSTRIYHTSQTNDLRPLTFAGVFTKVLKSLPLRERSAKVRDTTLKTRINFIFLSSERALRPEIIYEWRSITLAGMIGFSSFLTNCTKSSRGRLFPHVWSSELLMILKKFIHMTAIFIGIYLVVKKLKFEF